MSELEEYIAKLRVHAAAPDLLAVCEEIVAYEQGSNRWGDEDYLDVPLDLLCRIKDAIAKAKGERS